MIENHEFRRVRGKIRRLLPGVRGPIDVENSPTGQDGYAFSFFELLTQAKSEKVIVECLLKVVNYGSGPGSTKAFDTHPALRVLREMRLRHG